MVREWKFNQAYPEPLENEEKRPSFFVDPDIPTYFSNKETWFSKSKQ